MDWAKPVGECIEFCRDFEKLTWELNPERQSADNLCDDLCRTEPTWVYSLTDFTWKKREVWVIIQYSILTCCAWVITTLLSRNLSTRDFQMNGVPNKWLILTTYPTYSHRVDSYPSACKVRGRVFIYHTFYLVWCKFAIWCKELGNSLKSTVKNQEEYTLKSCIN